MTDVSPRRRLAARTGIAAALFALPMTASICYASAAEPTPPPPAVPAPPSAPTPPEAPLPPESPLAPEAVDPGAMHWEDDAHAGEQAEWRREQAEALREAAEEAREGAREAQVAWAEGRAAYAESRKEWAEGRIEWARGRAEHGLGRAEHARAQAEAARERAEAAARVWTAADQARVDDHVAKALRNVPQVIESCRYPDQPVTSQTTADGRTTLYVCDSAGDRIALAALRSTRASIASNTGMPAELRTEILRDLDRDIAEHTR